VLDLEGDPIRIISLHTLPFHRFDRTPQEFHSMWSALAKSISQLGDLPILVGGDFNTGHRELLTEQLDGQFRRAIGNQGTHRGKDTDTATDDILFTDGFDLVGSKVIGTQSDHALCLADFERRLGWSRA
jgi:hypothetical protein